MSTNELLQTRSTNLAKNTNALASKQPLGNLNGRGQLASKQPAKRTALSSTTNLLNKNALNGNHNGKAGGLAEKKDVKVSTTESASNETKAGRGLAANRSRIPTKNVAKFEQIRVQKVQPPKPEEPRLTFSSFRIPENVENIDQYDSNNVLLVNDFSNDIYIYLGHLEESLKLEVDFLSLQLHVTSKMRARLIDWIIAVHHKFKLLPETLYLTIAIMDRFLAKVCVAKDKVQLVGLTAFFIACKYEEIYPPEITDFIRACDAYSKNEIIKMEKTVLKALDFKLSYPLPLHFLRRFSKAACADSEIHTLAKYLMELGLVEYECASWKPSLLAAASLYLTLQILTADDFKWTDTLAFYTNYKEADLQPHVSTLSKILLMTKDSKLQVSLPLSVLSSLDTPN